jgi:hypothetical protein
MITYELTAAICASVILFTLVLFPVSGYVRAVAMGALDVYGGLHNFIVFLCAPVVITPLSYFLDHHRIAEEIYLTICLGQDTGTAGVYIITFSVFFPNTGRGSTAFYQKFFPALGINPRNFAARVP